MIKVTIVELFIFFYEKGCDFTNLLNIFFCFIDLQLCEGKNVTLVKENAQF